jgi:hypothetical protein
MLLPFVTFYGFGTVRVAMFTLLTFTALLGSRSCGGCYRQILRPGRHLPKFADALRNRLDARVHFNPHLIWQATKSYVERGDAFWFVTHECSLLIQDTSV